MLVSLHFYHEYSNFSVATFPNTANASPLSVCCLKVTLRLHHKMPLILQCFKSWQCQVSFCYLPTFLLIKHCSGVWCIIVSHDICFYSLRTKWVLCKFARKMVLSGRGEFSEAIRKKLFPKQDQREKSVISPNAFWILSQCSRNEAFQFHMSAIFLHSTTNH